MWAEPEIMIRLRCMVKVGRLISLLWVNKKGDFLGWAWPNQTSPLKSRDQRFEASEILLLTLKKQVTMSCRDARKWILLTATRAQETPSLRWDLRRDLKPAYLVRPEQRPQISCSQIPEPWKLWDNKCVLFLSHSICYTAIITVHIFTLSFFICCVCSLFNSFVTWFKLNGLRNKLNSVLGPPHTYSRV